MRKKLKKLLKKKKMKERKKIKKRKKQKKLMRMIYSTLNQFHFKNKKLITKKICSENQHF